MNGVMDGEVGHVEKERPVLIVIDVAGRQLRQAVSDILSPIQTENFLGVVNPLRPRLEFTE